MDLVHGLGNVMLMLMLMLLLLMGLVRKVDCGVKMLKMKMNLLVVELMLKRMKLKN